MSQYDISWGDMTREGNPAGQRPGDYLPLTPALFHVLLALADGDKHGYAILKEVSERTHGAVVLSTGTLYGIIKRLLADGMIRRSAVGTNERRQAYRLTPFGRAVALAEIARLRDLVVSAESKKLVARPSRG
jgi:DNA-binding PadR family transcriptional regulator